MHHRNSCVVIVSHLLPDCIKCQINKCDLFGQKIRIYFLYKFGIFIKSVKFLVYICIKQIYCDYKYYLYFLTINLILNSNSWTNYNNQFIPIMIVSLFGCLLINNLLI